MSGTTSLCISNWMRAKKEQKASTQSRSTAPKCVQRKTKVLILKYLNSLRANSSLRLACYLDIQNGFHHIAVNSEHHKFLSIRWKGRWYQWKVLPFVFNGSRYFFYKTLRSVIQHLRQLGLRFVIYVDDIYISLYYLWLAQRRLRITSSFSWIR